MNTIKVYDILENRFRDLIPNNYNDDLIIGAIQFTKAALEEIKKDFIVCGYMIVHKASKIYYPIDIHAQTIVLLEGSYNCLSKKLQQKLSRYNIVGNDSHIFSPFFIDWILRGNWDCFIQHGPFIKMCSHFFEDQETLNLMAEKSLSIVKPTNYDELCDMTRAAIELSGADFYSPDYIESNKYAIDALIHHYHILFSSEEVEEYTYQICSIICTQWEESHA